MHLESAASDRGMGTRPVVALALLPLLVLTGTTGMLWGDDAVHGGVNQIHFQTRDAKIAVAFSNQANSLNP